MEFMAYDKAEEFIKELFESPLSKHQIGLKTSIKVVVLSLIFYLLHCKWHKVNFKRGGSYIGLPDWIKNKKAAISLINKMIINTLNIVALNFEKIGKILKE